MSESPAPVAGPAVAAGPPIDRRRARLWLALTLALCAAAVVLLIVRAWAFVPFVADDSLISFRYSERLLQGHGLTWTDGERVEGYSNLLWVLATAGLGAFGVDLILAGRLLGLAGMSAVVAAFGYAYRARGPRDLAPLVAGGAVVALAGPLAVWAIGGLEQALVAPLLAWPVALLLRALEAGPTRGRVLGAGVCLGLLCLTRPDGALLAGSLGIGLFLGAGPSLAALRLVLTLAVPPIVATLGQLGFRLAYYGDWVPNTAHAKLGFTTTRLLGGWAYLKGGVAVMPALAAGPAAAVGLLLTRRRGRALLVLCPALAWAGYVVAIGGDIFPAYRHLVPLIVLGAALVAEGTAWLVGRPRLVPLGLLGAALAAASVVLQRQDPEIDRARFERWEWEGKHVGDVLRRAFGTQRPLLAADPAGCLPFFSKLPSLDMLGLNDRFLATHPPPDFGRGPLAHELGDGAYVASRKPDLFFFCGPLGSDHGCFRSGYELFARPEFRAEHTPVFIETPRRALVAEAWIRREGRIGITRGAGAVHVPGFLFANTRVNLARPAKDGRLMAHLAPGEAARLSSVPLPAGRWRIAVEPAGDLLVRARASAAPIPEEGAGAVMLDLPAPTTVDLELLAPAGATRIVREVVATTAADPPNP